jgi:cell division protein FtsI (penicillin-binding protein 3)
MIQKGTLYRSTLLAIAFLAAFGGLGFRLYHLQVVRHKELLTKVRNLHERKQFIAPVRGDILDANMNVLAQTITVWNVAADPDLMKQDVRQWAKLLAPALEMREAELVEKLSRPARHVALKKKVSDEIVADLKEQIDGLNAKRKRTAQLRGLKFEREFQRYYPNAVLASHVIGFTYNEWQEYGSQQVSVQKGGDGIENFYNQELTGTVGYRLIEKNRRGEELVTFRSEDVPPQNGCRIVLTIDQTIQHIVEEELERVCEERRPASAVAIVMRPDTGEILAMANRPTFDLNDPNKDVSHMKNIAIADMHEPGSTFKIIVVGAGLDQKVVSLEDTFFCENGKFLYAGSYLHDHKPYGYQTVLQIVAHSVNIGAAKIALKLGEQPFYQYICKFGFGERTEIQLPGEAKGLVHSPKNYSKISQTRIAMGHEITVTPLQTILAMSAIANGGNLMKPTIVKRIVNEENETMREFTPVVRRRVLGKAATQKLTAALVRVVSPDGTAEKASLPGWTVAGKTGTAQKLEDGRYVDDKYYSSFVGFLPAEKPQLCILVGLDDIDDYGGQAAAPVFQQIAARSAAYLDLHAPPGRIKGNPFAVAGTEETPRLRPKS